MATTQQSHKATVYSRNFSSQRSSGNDTGSTDEGGTDVGQDVTVQVRADDGVELLRFRYHLHGAEGARMERSDV